MPVVKTRYFKEAFESAVAQSFDDYEIIVINNLADSDVSWVCECAKVKYFSHEIQLPPCKNWNFGLQQAQGTFVIYLSDDDILLEDCLEKLDEFIRVHSEADVIRVLRLDIDSEGKVIGGSCPGAEWESREQYLYYQYHYRRTQMLTDVALRRAHFLTKGGFAEEMEDIIKGWGSDHRALIECADSGVYNLNKICVKYRLHSESLSNSSSSNAAENRFLANQIWIERARSLIRVESQWAFLAKGTLEMYEKELYLLSCVRIFSRCKWGRFFKFLSKNKGNSSKLALLSLTIVQGISFLLKKKMH